MFKVMLHYFCTLQVKASNIAYLEKIANPITRAVQNFFFLMAVTVITSSLLISQFFIYFLLISYFLDFIYFFRERRREGERDRNINVWLLLVCPLLGTWPITQAYALTGNQTGDPFFCRPMLNRHSLSYTSQSLFLVNYLFNELEHHLHHK